MTKIKTYDCGVRLVVDETKDKECTLGIGINCGSKNEKTDEFGLAHFLEHLFFKSTKTRSTKELANDLEGLGTSINAWTSEDNTFFHFKSLKENLEKSFIIYCDMFFNGIFEKDEVDRERKVVLEEIKVYEDNSFSRLLDSCTEIIYDKTTYSHNVLGSEEVIKNTSIEKIKAFKKRNYTPENIVISVAGGVKFKDVDKMVKKHFCNNFSTKNTPNQADVKEVKIKYPKNYFSIQKEDKQVRLVVIYKGENFTSKDKFIENYYKEIMGEGLSSRMFMYLREQQGLCYSTCVYTNTMNKAGNIVFYIGAAPEKLEACVKGIKFLIKQAGDEGFSVEEFNKAKNKLKAHTIFSVGTGSKARSNFRNVMNIGRTKSEEEILKLIEDVTLEDVNKYAKKVANDKNFLVAAIGDKINMKTLKLFDK